MLEDTDGTSFPPHSRLVVVEFTGSGSLQVERENHASEEVPVSDVLSLHGARIRRESMRFSPQKKGGTMIGKMTLLAMGVPVNPLPGKPRDTTTKSEDMHYVLGMRVRKREDLWFLMATSFNFRKALGADAAFSLEMNVRAFIQKLGDFCPGARRDRFFEAALAKAALPEPIDSLLEFIKATYGS
ncbi:MAG: hypothetical protein RDV48_05480 [Candidatus Eremiobacteraeota bacterium]|nr:hypothetical protein [Candidatus Eremiobacteraeota bacterium]